MGALLPVYLQQRVCSRALADAIMERIPIEVHGIYPYDVAPLVPGARLVGSSTAHSSRHKLFNTLRPLYYFVSTPGARAKPRLIVAVPPGRDYLMHHASLVNLFLLRSDGPAFSAIRYPRAERSIAYWTGLDRFIRPGDRLVIGHVEDVVRVFLESGAGIGSISSNPYYCALRLHLPRTASEVVALGVRFSYWGSIAARLAQAVARAGAAEIVYVGKLGALTCVDDLYNELFCPSSYLQWLPSGRMVSIDSVPRNGLLSYDPRLDSGRHISVGTVLEESYALRLAAALVGVSSIDNEISQVAGALAGNARSPCSFSAIHYATDYLPQDADERATRPAKYALTNHRSAEARQARFRALTRIGGLLYEYFQATHRNETWT